MELSYNYKLTIFGLVMSKLRRNKNLKYLNFSLKTPYILCSTAFISKYFVCSYILLYESLQILMNLCKVVSKSLLVE